MSVDNSKTVVKYSARFVRNLGNYETLAVDIGIEDGIRGDEKVSEAFARVKDFVESRLLDAVHEIEADLNNARSK